MFERARRLVRRLGILFRRGEHERRMDEEMRYHIDMEAGAVWRVDEPLSAAQRRARIAFGSVERFKEEARDVRGTRLLEDLVLDVGYAVRQLRASPAYAMATLLTLALGIGAATMMHSSNRFITSGASMLSAPHRLVFLGQGPKKCVRCSRMAPGNYLTIRDQTRSLANVTMFMDWDPILRGAERSELVDGARVTTEFFRTLEIPALFGRPLMPGDSGADRQHVVVLSEGMWRTRFGSDRAVLGRTMILDRVAYTIVGVVPRSFVYPRDTEFWVPWVLTSDEANDRGGAAYRVVGRLHNAAAVAAVATEVAVIAARLAAEFPGPMGGSTFVAASLSQMDRQAGDSASWTMAAAVVLVLLVSWINLAGLLIARLSVRQRELAVRRALGAPPGRIVRQLLVETLLITALGGACGAALAAWGLRALIGWAQLDAHGFSIALLLGFLSGVVIGLWPSFRFARPQLVQELRNATRTATGNIDTARGRRVLVIAEVAMAIVLLSAAGLLARSFEKTYAVDSGFRTDRLLTMRIQNPPPAPDADPDPHRIDRLVQAIEAVPGVERAGAVLGMPFGVGAGSGSFEIAGHAAGSPAQRPRVRMQAASPGYFDALGIPLLRGRVFTGQDGANASRVAIINQVFARRFFPDENPIGRAVVIDSVRWEIVGVVGAVFYGDVEQLESAELYRPMAQWQRRTLWIAARTREDPARLRPALTAAVRSFDPDIAVTRLFTMNQLRADSMGSERRILRIMGAFALAAMLISAIGLYGLISYSVAQRRREFGVRLALGARSVELLRLVLGQGIKLAAIGTAIGIAGAFGALRLLRSLLFGVSSSDPLTLGIVVLLICAVALLAAYIPARRAMRIDPMTSLREE